MQGVEEVGIADGLFLNPSKRLFSGFLEVPEMFSPSLLGFQVHENVRCPFLDPLLKVFNFSGYGNHHYTLKESKQSEQMAGRGATKEQKFFSPDRPIFRAQALVPRGVVLRDLRHHARRTGLVFGMVDVGFGEQKICF